MQLRNLRIGKSNIADTGIGLFSARKPIPRVSFTTEYKGTESSNPISGNYVSQVGQNKWVNSNRSINIGGFANDCRTANRRANQCPGNNAKFSYNRRSRKTNMVTTRDIPPRTEICVPYDTLYT